MQCVYMCVCTKCNTALEYFFKKVEIIIMTMSNFYSRTQILNSAISTCTIGNVVNVHMNNYKDMVDCICELLHKDMPRLPRFQRSDIVKYLCVSRIFDMTCITLCLESTKNEYPKPFKETYDTDLPCAFCYVINLDRPEFSEFGDVFFVERENHNLFRV